MPARERSGATDKQQVSSRETIRVSELNCTTRRRRGKQGNRKSSKGEECLPLTAEVVDSHEKKDTKRNKRIDLRTRAGGGMRSKGRKNVQHLKI